MSIHLGRSGQNLTIRVVPASVNEKVDRDKLINKLIVKKIPIYKADTFLYFEIPVASIPKVYELWKDDEITVDLKAQGWIDTFRYNNIPLLELPKSEITFKPKDGRTLKPHQVTFCEIDHNKNNIACFLDTGAGKATAMLVRLMHYQPEKPILVFTTVGNFPDWERDLRDVLGAEYQCYTGTKAQRDKIDITSKQFLISNYEQAAELSQKINPDSFDGIILDEVDQVGNPSSKKHKSILAIQRLIKNRKFTLTATATPIEQDLEPLWGLLLLTDPNVAGKKDEFLSKYQGFKRYIDVPTRNGGTFKKGVDPITKNLDDLRRLISTIAFRVDVSTSFKFKEHRAVFKLDMTARQWDVYKEIKEEIKQLAESGDLFKGNPLPKFSELFRVAEGLWDEGEIHSVKYHEICNRLRKTDKKTILWSGYVAATEAYYKQFEDCAVIYNGNRSAAHKKFAKLAFQGASDSVEEADFYKLREKLKDYRFEKPGDARLFIATSSLSGGRGLNLPAAELQIYSSISLSGRATKQSAGRNKRQTTIHSDLYEEFYVSENTIDVRFLTKVFSKIDNASSLLDGVGSISQIKARDLLRMV